MPSLFVAPTFMVGIDLVLTYSVGPTFMVGHSIRKGVGISRYLPADHKGRHYRDDGAGDVRTKPSRIPSQVDAFAFEQGAFAGDADGTTAIGADCAVGANDSMARNDHP